MVRVDSDRVNWALVIVLVAVALLLATVSSVGYGDQVVAPTKSLSGPSWQSVGQNRKEVVVAPSELCYVARELYLAGRFAEASETFERAAIANPMDPIIRMWSGIAAYRTGDSGAAIRHWRSLWCDEVPLSESGVWPGVALVAAYLEADNTREAARIIVPLERGDFGSDAVRNPVVSFYAALVFERFAGAAPRYRDAVEESIAERFSPAFASSDPSFGVSPNSQSWFIFLTKRALQRTIRCERSLEWAAPSASGSVRVDPSLAPTVEELLVALDSADFASQARGKLRALQLYESSPERRIDIFDDPDMITRRRFIA